MSDSVIPTPATPDVCTVALLVGGQAVPSTFHVLSITVNRELNRIPSAAIQVEDGEAAKATFAACNADCFLPAKQIETQLGYRSQHETVFKGTIVKQRINVRKSGSALYVDCFAHAVKATEAHKSS